MDDEDEIQALLMKEMANAGLFGEEVSDESIFGSEKVEDLLEKR